MHCSIGSNCSVDYEVVALFRGFVMDIDVQ